MVFRAFFLVCNSCIWCCNLLGLYIGEWDSWPTLSKKLWSTQVKSSKRKLRWKKTILYRNLIKNGVLNGRILIHSEMEGKNVLKEGTHGMGIFIFSQQGFSFSLRHSIMMLQNVTVPSYEIWYLLLLNLFKELHLFFNEFVTSSLLLDTLLNLCKISLFLLIIF